MSSIPSHFDRQFQNKEEIQFAVYDYHRSLNLDFCVELSDSKRFSCKCKANGCPFRISFFFANNIFKPPTIFIPHNCLNNIQASTRFQITPKYLCLHPVLKKWINNFGYSASISSLRAKLRELNLGSHHVEQTLCRTLTQLKEENLYSVPDQYSYLKDYVEKLKFNGHKAVIEEDNGALSRIAVAFHQGIQAYSTFMPFGLQLDGTFLKGASQGILLIACIKDSSNKIFITAVAIVTIENEANWKWFLEFLKSSLIADPFWVISDREKGLSNAVKQVFPMSYHFYCFRHIMENMMARFRHDSEAPQRKNKNFWSDIKSKCWALARSLTVQEFENIRNSLGSVPVGAKIVEWLGQIGFDRFVLGAATTSRYGILTSNNVESINSRLLHIRSYPILDLLMEIEVKVNQDRYRRMALVSGANTGDEITDYARNKLQRLKMDMEKLNFEFIITGNSSFYVKLDKKSYEVNLAKGCSCGFPLQYNFPCMHMLFLSEKLAVPLAKVMPYIWLTETFYQAYREIDGHDIRNSIVCASTLKKITLHPMKIRGKRGRKKVKRVRGINENLEISSEKKQSRCSKCHQLGHKRPTCRQ